MLIDDKILGIICRECKFVGYASEKYIDVQKRCVKCGSENIMLIDHGFYISRDAEIEKEI